MNETYTWPMKQFGRRLRKLRQDRGLSQAALARLAKIHVMQVGKYERGEGYPAVESLVGLSRALGTSIDFLVSGEEEPARDEKAFRFPLLLEKVRELDHELERPDVGSIVEFLDAFLAKKRIKKMMSA